MEKLKGLMEKMGVVFIAGFITGIISGVLLRVIMGIVALVFPEMARGLTLSGVIALLFTGIGFCLANSILFVLVEGYLPTNWFVKGITYGTINLIVYGIPFFLSNPDNDLFGPQALLGIILFSSLFIIGGLLLSQLFRQISIWIRIQGRVKYMYISFFVFIIPALIMLAGTTYEVFYETIPSIRSNW